MSDEIFTIKNSDTIIDITKKCNICGASVDVEYDATISTVDFKWKCDSCGVSQTIEIPVENIIGIKVKF